MISGRVSLPRIPAIIRLRTAGETTSATSNHQLWQRFFKTDSCDCGLNMGRHQLRDGPNNRHDDGVTKLPVRLSVRYGNAKAVPLGFVEPHEASALARG